jgi:hydrogenase maturation factor
MHDISEGGVKKALNEVSSALGMSIEIDSNNFIFVDGVDDLGEDPLKLPTYGSLISLIDPENENEVHQACKQIDVTYTAVGVIRKGEGLYIDGVKVEDLRRVNFDKLYGTFKRIE